ncbi:MAG: hypothetical protein FWE77_00110 [Clostridia bacterium]|nr:hypothetical protein [Clostridia bacterium]
MSAIIDRILARLADQDLLEKLLALPKSDLNSLLLELHQRQANDTSPAEVVRAFEASRFPAPSALDPVAYRRLEAEFLSSAQEAEIEPVLLSPSAPFASCSAFGCVSQSKVMSAVRGTETLSDPTNMLAIIIAAGLKNRQIDNRSPLHYCATARIIRGQVFPNTKHHFAHFGILGIVSSGKDGGSYLCEKSLLLKHLTYYKELLVQKFDARLSIVLRKRGGYPDGDGFFDGMKQLVIREFPDAPLSFDVESEENHYYKGVHFKLYMEKENTKMEIGDGGFVDWMQRMTNNKKERCLISGIGLDRLLLL